MASLGDLMVRIGANVEDLNSGLGEASGKISEFANHSLEALAGVAESLAFEKLGESLLKAGEDFEKAGFTFQKTAGATGAALEGLEENFASLYLKSSQSSENLASALAQLSIRTGATGEDLENLATSFGKLTKVVGGDLNANVTESERLFKQWGIDIEDQKGKLDALVVITQKTGISYATLAEQLTAFGPILRNMGFDFDQSAALLGKFDSSGLGTQQIMRALGQGLSELGQKFADPEQALRLLIERMAAAPSTTVALQIALSEGLGKKGALALADAVHQGVFAIDDLVKAAQNSGGTIDDIAGRTQTLSGQWTKFQHALEEALVPLGKDLIGALTAALDAIKPLAGILGDVIKWFETLPAPIKYTAEALGAIVAVTPGVIVGIKGIALAWEALGLGGVVSSLKGVTLSLIGMEGPLTLGATRIAALGTAGIFAAAAFAGWELGKWLETNTVWFKNLEQALASFIARVPGLSDLQRSMNGVSDTEAEFLKNTNAIAAKLSEMGIEIERGPNQSLYQYHQAVVDAAEANKGLIAAWEAAHPALTQHADDAQKAKTAIEALHAQYTSGQITLDQYNTRLQALTAALAPSAAAMAKAAKEAADWNDKWTESAKRAMDVVAEVGSGDAGPEQAFSKLNSVIETGSINFDKLSAAGVKAYLSLVASLNDMRKAMADAQNNEALDAITQQLANIQIKASELADKVPLDFKDMMAGVTEGVNFTGIEKQLQSTIDGLADAAKTASPEFKEFLQAVIDKSQGALNGLRSMTGALALIGQDRSMETLAVQIKGLIDQQNKGALSGEQWQAGLNGVSDALLKKIIPAMQQGVPISQALVDQLAKIPGIGAQLAAAANQGFDAFNNAVTKWAETTRASVLSVNDAFKDLGVTSLDATSQAMTRSGNDIIAVLKNISDSTALTTAQFTADQAAVIAWGEKVLPPMAQFGQSVSDDVLAQVAKISPALAQAAKDGPDAFAAALDALKTKAVTSTMTIADAFHDLGVKSGRELNDAADVASAAYNKIAASGTASANTQRDALIKALQAEKAAYIAQGVDLPAEEQRTLDKLLNQQSYFNQQHEDQWHTLYLNIDGQIMGLSNKLVQDLFEGNGSFGKTALKALEGIGAAVVSAFIAPATKAIADFIAGSIANLLSSFQGLGKAAMDTGSTVKTAFFGDGAGGGGASGGLGGGVMGALGSAVSALSGIITMVASVVGAVAGIIGDIQTIHTQKILADIEHNTRYSMIYLGEQGQSILWSVQKTAERLGYVNNSMDTMKTTLWEIRDAVKAMVSISIAVSGGKAVDLGAAIGQYIQAGDTAVTDVLSNMTIQLRGISQAIVTGFQNLNNDMVHFLGSIDNNISLLAKSQSSLFDKFLSGSGLFGGGNLGGGIAGIAAGFLGGITSLFSGNDSATYKQIELNTRRLDIATTQQSQSVLWSVQTTAERLSYANDSLNDIKSHIWTIGADLHVSLLNLSDIASNTFWAMKKLDSIDSKTGKTTASPTDTAQLGALDWMKTALGNINTTLQFNVGLSPWFQTAFQNLNNSVVACAGWLQGISNMFSSGAAKVGGGTPGAAPAADSFTALAGFVNSQFSTLYTWLGAAFKPLLTVFGGQGLTIAPGLPSIPSFAGAAASGGGTAAAIDFTSLQTFMGSQFSTLLAGVNGLSVPIGAVVTAAKVSDQITLAGFSQIVKGQAESLAQGLANLSGLSALQVRIGQLSEMVSANFAALIAAVKLTIQIPASVTTSPLALAGAAANIVSSSSNTQTNTPIAVHFHNPVIMSAKHATEILNIAHSEVRRRNRIIG